MTTIHLPTGTTHIPFDDLAELMADAMYPCTGEDDERTDYGIAWLRFESELARAVKSGELLVRDSITKGLHPYPLGNALKSALVSVNDLRAFLADREIEVITAPAKDTETAAPVASASDGPAPNDGVENIEEREFLAAFSETVKNGGVINWRYWVKDMPMLTAAEAARLMCGLDPDLFKSLDSRPNKNDPSRMCKKAAMIQRLAERHGKESARPDEWITWASEHQIAVHDGFRLEVELAPAKKPPAPEAISSNTPAVLKNKRPDLLTPLIEAAQRGETDPFSAAIIWPKLCSMAERKTRPLIGESPDGIKWTDSNDTVQFLTKSALGDRLRRAKKAR